MGMLRESWMTQRPPQCTAEKLPAVYGSCSTLQRGERFCLAGLFKNKPERGWGWGERKQGGEISAVVTELKDEKT